jgi:spiro-SPASM protein
MIAEVLNRRRLELIIETSGIGWPPDIFAMIKSGSDREPRWIVSLDAHENQVYEKLRGEGFDEALRTVDSLKDAFPGRVHVQAVRMHENEDDLEHFFRHWKDSLGNVIIQKYDDFCGKLPDRKVTDLSPVKRMPCWHIKRDVTILLDGRVLLCREDIGAGHLLGNIFQEKLQASP